MNIEVDGKPVKSAPKALKKFMTLESRRTTIVTVDGEDRSAEFRRAADLMDGILREYHFRVFEWAFLPEDQSKTLEKMLSATFKTLARVASGK